MTVAAYVTAAMLTAAMVITPTPADASTPCPQPIAHRGVHNASTDEDTIDAIIKSARYGAAEVDVRVTADNRLVLMHDKGVNRTTNGTGLVHDLTLAEIRQFRTNITGSRIPTFNQAARAAAAHDVILVAELKLRSQWTPALYALAGRIATRAGTVYLGGKGWGFEHDIPRYAPGALIYWRPLDGVTPTPAAASSRDATMVMQRIATLTADQVTALRTAGYVTAVRLTHDFPRADALGVDYALTNNPHNAVTYCRSTP